nr:uncharacterized protein LOC112005210 isoform X1 [Quercus suber]XP_023893234.1 uncharacterized protein LOC112005210 isoform X1 [Quercus suber]XP_023912091.1 uncharacterized protein LOC112023700 [Quercus suber]XP_023912092.1 uncharacterized protein LOC112023700 [Quercus suber]
MKSDGGAWYSNYAGSGRAWPQTTIYGLTCLRKDGEEIMPCSMLLLVQNHGHRVGLGLKIIREGGDYYLVHHCEIQRCLGSRRQRKGASSCTLDSQRDFHGEESQEEGSCRGILDKILFFIGDLEVASIDGKRG